MQIKITKLPNSIVEIEGELDENAFEGFWNSALKKVGKGVKIDGFREGKIPENILLANVPEIKILEEMAELALSEHYPKIVEEHKLDVISRPEISITKLARKNPLGFKIRTNIMPEIKLPNFKEIAKNILSKVSNKDKEVTITDEEVESTIMDIRKSRAKKIPMKEVGETHTHEDGTVHDANENPVETKDGELPEFNDEFVQAIGPFENVEDFKDKLRDNLKLEKYNLEKEKTRLKIIEEIIDKSEFDVPEILTNLELDKILYRMESDISQMGMKFEDYLKHLNKTKDDLRKEFTNDAVKKAKLSLVLNEIAKVEKIIADEKEVEREVENILEHYKEADPVRAKMHAENVLTNEKIFQFLENLV